MREIVPFKRLSKLCKGLPAHILTNTWENDHLNRKGKVVVGKDPKLQNKLISMFHDSTVGGHLGMTITSKTIEGMFYWKGQQKHIRQYIRKCNIYQRNKHENVASLGLL
jgi:hypothetical protein